MTTLGFVNGEPTPSNPILSPADQLNMRVMYPKYHVLGKNRGKKKYMGDKEERMVENAVRFRLREAFGVKMIECKYTATAREGLH